MSADTCIEKKPDCSSLEMTKLSVNWFHRMLNKKSASTFQVGQIVSTGPASHLKIQQTRHARLNTVLEKFKSAIRSALAGGFPTKTFGDNKIEVGRIKAALSSVESPSVCRT